MPKSPRVAATTSDGRPKTNGNGLRSAPSTSGKNRIRILTSLGDLTGTGVLVVKSGNESERLTPEVDLVMSRTLGENGSLTLSQRVDDEASPVLLDEPGFHITVGDVKELGRSGMGMGGVHSTRSSGGLARGSERRSGLKDILHLTDSHGHAVREEGREIGDTGDSQVSASTPDGTDSCVEIEKPLIQTRRSAARSKCG